VFIEVFTQWVTELLFSGSLFVMAELHALLFLLDYFAALLYL
jgi:hypothetical protein